jgi:hypothetical protein
MAVYPEHEKLAKVSDRSQVIGEFLDWLRNDQGIVLAEYGPNDVDLFPARRHTIEDWLALYFKIDLAKIEREKRAMLEAIRT